MKQILPRFGQYLTALLLFLTMSTMGWGQGTIYQHLFGTTTISGKPYDVAPDTFNSNLSNSSWTTSASGFTSYAGSSGQALSLANSSGNPTYTMTFNVASGYKLSITQFSFWRQRSSSGAQNWSMTINGINVGSGTVSSSGANIGTTNVSNTISDVTGTVTIVLTLSGASGTGTFRLDDFTLIGTVESLASNTITTGLVTGAPFCVDATNSASGTVAYTSTGTYNSTFTAELSDATGSFDSPVTVGTGASPMNITIPANTPSGNGYRIRVVNDDPSTVGSNSDAFTIINGVPLVTSYTATPQNQAMLLSWVNPVGCFDEVLVVAKASASISGTPTGAETANLAFGDGDAFDGGFVVYKGTTSPQTISNLVNGTTYYFKLFVRKGAEWSAGQEVTGVPLLVDNPKITWINSATATAWYTPENWNPTKLSSEWLTTDVALFENSGTAIVAGINMGTSSLFIAGIEISNLRSRALAVGNSSSTAGTLTLNGGVINGNLNTILRNNSGFSLTLQNNVQNSSTANLIFNNSNSNNIVVDGSGDIIIASSITSASGPITISGIGSGIVEFSGQNTYTTATNINSSTLRLNRTGGETLPSSNSITITTGATLRVSTNQTLTEVNLNGGTILIDEGAILNVSTLNVTEGSLSGLGSLRVNEVLNKTTSGEFITNGQLILTSNAISTARVAQVSGSISGNAVVERYIPAKRAWRFLTAPVTGSTNNSVYHNWQNNGAAGNNGSGVNLWAPNGTGNAGNGLVAGGGSPNIYKYKTVAPAGWEAITDTKVEALFGTTTNNAFMVFVTGGANSTNIATGAAATTMVATGALRVGDVNYGNLPSSNHTLIGNPYASPISPLAVLNGNSGFRDKLWVLDPEVGSVGQYVIYDKVAGYTNTSGSYQAGTNIQSGQAFFVRRSSLLVNESATFTITEAHKATAVDNGVFNRNAIQSVSNLDKLRVSLWKNTNNQWQNLDAVLAAFYPEGNNAIDMADGAKINGVGENLALMNGTSAFTLEHRATAIAQEVLPLRVSTMQEGANYQLRVQTDGFNNQNVEVFLHDTFTNTFTVIPTDDTLVTYPFAVTSAAASTGNRFQIVFQNSPLSTQNPGQLNQAVVYPNPVNEGTLYIALPTATYQKVALYNALGQMVYQQNASVTTNLLQISTKGLANGYYQLQVEGQQGQVYQAKVIIQ